MRVTLRAIDEVGGQAIVVADGSWFRVSLDTDWTPVPLRDEIDAIHCMASGAYVEESEEFVSLAVVVELVRSRWSATREGSVDIFIGEILDLCPRELQVGFTESKRTQGSGEPLGRKPVALPWSWWFVWPYQPIPSVYQKTYVTAAVTHQAGGREWEVQWNDLLEYARFILRKSGRFRRLDAEDVLSETFVRFNKLFSYQYDDDATEVSQRLVALLHYTARDMWHQAQKRGRRVTLVDSSVAEGDEFEPVDPRPGPFSQLVTNELWTLVGQAVSRLTDPQQVIFQMMVVDNLGAQETASQLKTSPTTVSALKKVAIKAVKESLSNFVDIS